MYYALAALGGAAVAFVLIQVYYQIRRRDAQSEAKEIIARAERDAANRRKEAELEIKELALAQKTQVEQELNKTREELRERDRALEKRAQALDQAQEDIRKQERMLEANQKRLKEKTEEANRKNEELTRVLDMQRGKLHEITGLNRETAEKRLMEMVEQDLSQQIGALILRQERKIMETVEQKARDHLITAMQRFAASHTAETTTSTIDIPTDDMKGRIIGREGRNIRAFEKATGVDVIIDDTPGVVIVSGFDPVRREVARLALTRLIADGRIHPARIEEITAETQREIEALIDKRGAEAAEEVGVMGLHPKVLHMLGRLHFRTSYSQNVLRHSVEVAFLAGMMAEMVGLRGDVARRAGLLHDIGKASDHEMEGGHPKIGADLLRRHGESQDVVHAALGHHDEIITEYPYTVLVAAADACSASRPGARRESLERYIKRMEELESIASSFPGVEQAYAIQAGRELRVIASAKDTDDAKAAKLCRDIARAFEEQLTYPGEIKVTVVRESRFMDMAR